MRCALISALLLTFAGPALAQIAPDVTPISGPCTAAQVQSLPYVSVQGSTLTAISFTNPSSDTIATVQACAYDQQGNILGATSLHLPPNSWFIAPNGSGTRWLGLTQLFNPPRFPAPAPSTPLIP